MTTDNFTLPIKAGLPQTVADKFQNKNTLSSYIPIRTQGNDFDWSSVVGLVLRGLLCKKIEKYNYQDFTADCKNRSCIQCVDAPSNVVLTFNESANDPVMHFC